MFANMLLVTNAGGGDPVGMVGLAGGIIGVVDLSLRVERDCFDEDSGFGDGEDNLAETRRFAGVVVPASSSSDEASFLSRGRRHFVQTSEYSSQNLCGSFTLRVLVR